jgi:hypothetical protein
MARQTEAALGPSALGPRPAEDGPEKSENHPGTRQGVGAIFEVWATSTLIFQHEKDLPGMSVGSGRSNCL